MYVCVRGGPNQPLHRDPQWSIVLPLLYINITFVMNTFTDQVFKEYIKSTWFHSKVFKKNSKFLFNSHEIGNRSMQGDDTAFAATVADPPPSI
jgi:hypothetical protein